MMDKLSKYKNMLALLLDLDDNECKERKIIFLQTLNELRPQHFSDNDVNSINATLPKLLCVLKELVLSHRWIDVIYLLQTLVLNVSAEPEVVYKLSFEVFLQDGESGILLFQKLVNQLKVLKYYEEEELVLDYFLFVLYTCQQDYDKVLEAKAKSRTGQKSTYVKKSEHCEQLHRTYHGLVHYIEWCKLKAKLKFQKEEEAHKGSLYQGNIGDADADQQQLEIFTERACQCFQVCQSKTGVWDIFITKQIQMLEYHNKLDEARKIIEEYAQINYDNPYALKLLYDFYSKHKYDINKRIDALKLICQKDKGGTCVLELYHIYRDLKEKSDITLPLLFTLLDYPKWKKNIQIWTYLTSELTEIYQKNKVGIKDVEWNQRKDWWISYHFSFKPGENEELLFLKTIAAIFLISVDAEFVNNTIRYGNLGTRYTGQIAETKNMLVSK